jgi:pyruvate, water dikinase
MRETVFALIPKRRADSMPAQSYVRWFHDIRLDDVPLIGGKNASLGELYSNLTGAGVKVPNGFALTVAAYRDALASSGAGDKLHRLLDGLDKSDVNRLAQRAAEARQIVYEAASGYALRQQIMDSYRALEQEYGAGVAVAVRSSATAEDLPTASFAGQHDSFLNIHGEEDLFEACRRCFASIFTDRAIVYRMDNGFDHFKVALSVGVMKAGLFSRSIPNRDSAMLCSLPASMGSARSSCRVALIPTSSTSTSRRSSKDFGPCCAAHSAANSFE